MFLFNLIKFHHKCRHEHVAIDLDTSYCPDCGKLIKNEWFITRCSCCGVKMKAMIRNGKVVPQGHFCTNCGSKEFTVEQVEHINFIDINFAVLKRTEIEEEPKFTMTQLWQERIAEPPKLLVQYL